MTDLIRPVFDSPAVPEGDYESGVTPAKVFEDIRASSVPEATEDAEPLYNLNTHEWTTTCPCIRAEQTDPECKWHGRPEFRSDPRCANCGAAIAFDGEAWAHWGGTIHCPGGEPFGEVATPGTVPSAVPTDNEKPWRELRTGERSVTNDHDRGIWKYDPASAVPVTKGESLVDPNVVETARARLEEAWAVSPDAVTAWYREHREATRGSEDPVVQGLSAIAVPVTERPDFDTIESDLRRRTAFYATDNVAEHGRSLLAYARALEARIDKARTRLRAPRLDGETVLRSDLAQAQAERERLEERIENVTNLVDPELWQFVPAKDQLVGADEVRKVLRGIS